ncbi:MAG: hypothetical protein IT471_11360 [Pseudomonadales bacterium]|nr:hypothetical protein [Pseudomonadales bacterium]MCC6530843.1 hypothetical protein [Pseudomonadales bacterium]MCP5333003.1 hypothetical protein [Pseudomonadales bacterium]HMW15450.1 hypothetical protein [Pseudomonadales bacterium]HMW84228.1 hypothetical protein [Pseudomonadales bacterium]
MITDGSTLQIMTLAMGLGALHALDADHLAVVTSLGSRRPGWRHALGFTLRWALGHALSLIALATLLLVTARNFAEQLGGTAEQLAGFSLIAIALWLLAHPLHPSVDRAAFHNGDPPRPNRSPLLATALGLLHGVAGSAPILALIPLTQLQRPVEMLYFVLLFSSGVVLSMCLVGFLIGHFWQRIHHRSHGVARLLHRLVACTTLAIGARLLLVH